LRETYDAANVSGTLRYSGRAVSHHDRSRAFSWSTPAGAIVMRGVAGSGRRFACRRARCRNLARDSRGRALGGRQLPP
jgi:hypothetical protein